MSNGAAWPGGDEIDDPVDEGALGIGDGSRGGPSEERMGAMKRPEAERAALGSTGIVWPGSSF